MDNFISTDDAVLAEALKIALNEASAGVAEGGMPFGATVVVAGEIVGCGRNLQIQSGDHFAHAEIVAIRDAINTLGHLPRQATLVATEAPCAMCAGAAVISGFSRVYIGEDVHFKGAIDYLEQEKIPVQVAHDQSCVDLVGQFRIDHAELWLRFSAG